MSLLLQLENRVTEPQVDEARILLAPFEFQGNQRGTFFKRTSQINMNPSNQKMQLDLCLNVADHVSESLRSACDLSHAEAQQVIDCLILLFHPIAHGTYLPIRDLQEKAVYFSSRYNLHDIPYSEFLG